MTPNETTRPICSCCGAIIENDDYYEFDGSLSDGMEIVTHPMSLKYHKTEMPWADIMRSAVLM